MEKSVTIPAWIALPMLLAYEAGYMTTYETIDIRVEDRNTVFARGSAPQEGYTPVNWLVYTPDEVFKVGADWRRLEFKSAERYHQLKPGQVYRVQVAGWRVPALNWYRNIVRIDDH